MGIPGADSIISLSSSEMSEIRFNVSRIVGNFGMSRSDAPHDVESCSAPPHDINNEEMERDELAAITKDTCTHDPHGDETSDTVYPVDID